MLGRVLLRPAAELTADNNVGTIALRGTKTDVVVARSPPATLQKLASLKSGAVGRRGND